MTFSTFPKGSPIQISPTNLKHHVTNRLYRMILTFGRVAMMYDVGGPGGAMPPIPGMGRTISTRIYRLRFL